MCPVQNSTLPEASERNLNPDMHAKNPYKRGHEKTRDTETANSGSTCIQQSSKCHHMKDRNMPHRPARCINTTAYLYLVVLVRLVRYCAVVVSSARFVWPFLASGGLTHVPTAVERRSSRVRTKTKIRQVSLCCLFCFGVSVVSCRRF